MRKLPENTKVSIRLATLKRILNTKWMKFIWISSCSVVVLSLVLFASIYFGAFGKIPSEKELSSIHQEAATEVLDANERLIGKYFIYDRQPLAYKAFPQHLIDALVATEDVRFYEHDGIDNTSLARVFFKTILMQNASSGGGSTLTLQLAKNLFRRQRYAFGGIVIHKLKEAIIAKRIERIYTKTEILELYLNTVPFPDNTYGIESASRKFFNKPAVALTCVEAATLVGTLKANTYYNPRLHPKRCKERRNIVLHQMLKYDYLTEALTTAYSKDSLKLEYRSFNHDLGIAPYFRQQVKKELIQILDRIKKPDGTPYNLYKDGLQVVTTLDVGMQKAAENAVKAHMSTLQKHYEKAYGNRAPWKAGHSVFNAALKSLPLYKACKAKGYNDQQIHKVLSEKRAQELFTWQGDVIKQASTLDSLQHFLKFLNTGMLVISPKTGAIQAYIGGIDYRYFKYDNVSLSERQVGSTFKPFVYTAAIENGMKPCQYFSVKPVSYVNYENWTPKNSGKGTEDPFLNYSLEKALSQSINTVAVKVLEETGIENVIAQVKKLGITQEIPHLPSIALGVASINLKALTGAYASYVNAGQPVQPYGISEIRDRSGRTIMSFKPQVEVPPAFNAYTQQAVLSMMRSTVTTGTASRLRHTYKLKNAIAGKTGTTQDNKDGWFVAVTPKMVAVTWVGNPNASIGFSSTQLGQGANSALPIFAKFYQTLNKDLSYDSITKAKFDIVSPQAIDDLNCKSEKRDGLLKRLFKPNKKKKRFKDH